jgi:hypothetical protein
MLNKVRNYSDLEKIRIERKWKKFEFPWYMHNEQEIPIFPMSILLKHPPLTWITWMISKCE